MKFFRIILVLAFVFGLVGSATTPTQAQKLGGYSSSINVQNMTTTTANITLTFYNGDGSTANTFNDTLLANEAKNYYNTTMPVGDGFNGSVVISSDQPLAAISNLNHLETGVATARASFVGASSGQATVYLPLLASKLGAVNIDSWFSIQNAGATAATVSVTYSDTAACTLTGLNIPPGSSITIDNRLETCHTKTSFGAVIQSTQPVVAVVVQEKLYGTGASAYPNGQMTAYTGLMTSGATVLSFPVVSFNNSNIRSGIQIQNADTTNPSTVVVRYTPYPAPDGFGPAWCDESYTIPANGSVTYGWPSWYPTVPAGYTGSMTCVGGATYRGVKFVGSAYVYSNSANVKLQAVVSQVKDTTNRGGAYTAFAQSQASAKLVMPIVLDRRGAAALLFSVMQIFNMDPVNPTYLRCTINGNVASPVIRDRTLAANGAAYIVNRDDVGPNFSGYAFCETYTSAAYTTKDPNGKVVAVVSQQAFGTSQFYYDSLQIYEAINTTQ